MSNQANLITNKSNIQYLSNFTGSSGFLLQNKSKTYFFTDFRYIERAKDSIYKNIELIDITKLWKNPEQVKLHWQKLLAKHKVTVVGIDENDLTLAQFKKYQKLCRLPGQKIKFVNIAGEIEATREIKTAEEIAKTIKSQRINEKVFLTIKNIIHEALPTLSSKPLTELEVAWGIRQLGIEFGANDVSFDPIVAFGAHSARPHHEPTRTKLKKGDIILIDMGMKYQNYCSDMTRMIFTAPPTPKQKEIYNLVLEAQLASIKGIKAGLTGARADHLGRSIIAKAGYGEMYGHSGGHGIGLDIHESPALSEKYTKPLKENQIITIEPGIYLPGEFGVRIEDMLLITKSGNKNLTKIPKAI